MNNNLQNLILKQFSFLDMKQVQILLDNLNNISVQKNIEPSNLKVIGYGESSIVFELRNEIIKLTFMEYYNHPSMQEYVSHSNAILQPNFEIIIDQVKQYENCAKIIGLKKLSLEGITYKDVLNIYIKLRNDGYLWHDTKLRNVGKDENGNVFLIDYGELIYINDLDSYYRNKELEVHKNRKPKLNQYYYLHNFVNSKIRCRKSVK